MVALRIETTQHSANSSSDAATVTRPRFEEINCRGSSKLAESGASDSTIMALAGLLSRAMTERYSHIRMNYKRAAVESLSLKPKVQSAPQSSPHGEETARVLPAVKIVLTHWF